MLIYVILPYLFTFVKEVEHALYVLPEYKLAMCVPSKNGCAFTTATFSTINKNQGNFWISSFPKAHGIVNVENEIYSSSNWTIAMIVRNPVDRLKSAWLSKCKKKRKEEGETYCKSIFGNNYSVFPDAVEHVLQIPHEKRDRHVHQQIDFCYNITRYIKSDNVVIYQHSSLKSKEQLFSILRGVDVPHNVIIQSFKRASAILSNKFGNHRTSTPATLISKDLESRIAKDYQEDVNTFGILPRPPIEVLIPAMGFFDIVKRNMESLWRWYSVHIIIADDGPRDLTSDYQKYCFEKECTYMYLGFDRGLSFKRNRLAEAATSDLVFFCDADVVWTKNTDLLEAMKVFSKGASIVGFTYKNSRKNWHGKLWNCNNRVCLCGTQKKVWLDDNQRCFKTDITENIFLTSRQFILNHPWNETLKVYEHSSHFYSIKQNSKAVIVQCDDLEANHLRTMTNANWYKKLRYRPDVYKTRTQGKCPKQI